MALIIGISIVSMVAFMTVSSFHDRLKDCDIRDFHDDLGDYRGFVPKKVSKSTIFWTFLYLLPMAGIGIR